MAIKMEKLPPIKELKIAIQPNPKQETVWYAKAIIRKISIYFTWLLLQFKTTANQATFIQGFLGFTGSVLLATGGRDWAPVALIIIQIGYIFDCIDGEIARFRKTTNVNGVFFDSLIHAIVIPTMFAGLTLYSYFLTDQSWLLIAGVILCILSANPVKKGMLSAIFHLLERKNDPKYKYENLSQNVELNSILKTENANMKNGYYIGQKTFRQQIFNWLKAASEYPASMNIITLTVIADLLITKYTTSQIYPLPAMLVIVYLVFLLGKEMFFFRKLSSKNRIEKKFLQIIK